MRYPERGEVWLVDLGLAAKVNAAGGGNYQTMMNNVLREYVKSRGVSFEKTLRRVIREELRKRGAG